MRLKYGWILTLLAVALAGAADRADAGKPGGGGGGGVPPGAVYFRVVRSDTFAPGNYVMAADGSGKTPIPISATSSQRMLPSHTAHGGQRWFLEARDLDAHLDAYGRTVLSLVAVRGDGARVVRLTTDPNISVRRWGARMPGAWAVAAWLPGDTAVSWVGHRLDAGGVPVGGGIFVADLTFDANGEVSGLAGQPLAPTVPVDFASAPLPQVNVFELGWSPDGGRVAFERFEPNGDGATLNVANVAAGTQSVVLRGSDGYVAGAAWSPTADRIAFTHSVFGGYGIASVAANGTSLVVHLSASGTQQYHDPIWSPDGGYLVLTQAKQWTTGGTTTSSADVLRFDLASRTTTVLTGDLGSRQTRQANPHAWR